MNNNFGIGRLLRLELFGEEYFCEVRILLEKLKATTNPRSQCLYLKEFAKKYTLLPELWQHWNIVEKRLTSEEVDSLQYKHFKSTQELPSCGKHLYVNYLDNNYIETSMQKYKRIESLKEGLFYPHQGLNKQYLNYDRNSSSALTKKELKEYSVALNLYNKLKNAVENNDEWFKWLKETNDFDYIINTCEYRLSKNPYDTLFWYSYLHFLKSFDTAMMLKTYSRYCRLFLFDYYHLHEYYVEILNAEIPCKVEFWVDYVSLCKTFKSCDEASAKMIEILIKVYNMPKDWTFASYYFDENLKVFAEIIKSKEISSTFKTAEPNESSKQSLQKYETTLKPSIPKLLTPMFYQHFQFKSTIMRYILDNASPQLLQKLQMSCKELFLQKPIPCCHNLCIKKEFQTKAGKTEPVFYENALAVSSIDLQRLNLENYHLVNSLEIIGLSQITIPYFRKCSLKYLTIHNQTITENEMEFLTSKVQFVEFLRVTLTKYDETDAPIEYVIEKLLHVPNIKLIDPIETTFTETTSQNLAALKRDQKFKSFYLNQLPADFDIENFCKFVKANAAEDAELKFSYDRTIGALLNDVLGRTLKAELRKISNHFKFL
uniref:Uncharacterized protein n=1 Tax=Panagrolaimus sp. PS1159 TaxID=55785 RepID=A0AC35GJF7_9BILA